MTQDSASARLTSFVERIEHLENEKREIAAQIAEVKREAKSAGFEPKVITQMLRERRMSDAERQEWQALCETYRAALGMLNGTPLGDTARRRLMGQRPTAVPGVDDADDDDDSVSPPPGTPTQEDVKAAHDAGSVAFAAGKRIAENPYGASNPCRAAWDEGWCSAAGSDGMDIPPAWRRSPKKPDGLQKGA